MDKPKKENKSVLINPEGKQEIATALHNVAKLIEFNKKIKNSEPIERELANQVLDFHSQITLESAANEEYEEKVPTEEVILKTYNRFQKFKYLNAINSKSLKELSDHPKDFCFLIRETYLFMMNFEVTKDFRPLQFYEICYKHLSDLISEHSNSKSQKESKHYHRSIIATYIVIELELHIPPKTKPKKGYTNPNLFEISKNAISPFRIDF